MKRIQIELIENKLRQDGQIDNFWCLDTRLTTRLAMHIHLLRSRGWEIRTEELDNKNAVYHLVSEPAAKQLQLV